MKKLILLGMILLAAAGCTDQSADSLFTTPVHDQSKYVFTVQNIGLYDIEIIRTNIINHQQVVVVPSIQKSVGFSFSHTFALLSQPGNSDFIYFSELFPESGNKPGPIWKYDKSLNITTRLSKVNQIFRTSGSFDPHLFLADDGIHGVAVNASGSQLDFFDLQHDYFQNILSLPQGENFDDGSSGSAIVKWINPALVSYRLFSPGKSGQPSQFLAEQALHIKY